jgi:hypothetical protein
MQYMTKDARSLTYLAAEAIEDPEHSVALAATGAPTTLDLKKD